MNGDFKGDFTRDTFYKFNHFSRVLMQQGRVQLDADWNEQIDILLYYLRTLMVDLIGSHAAHDDKDEKGFFISQALPPAKTTKAPPPDITVGKGRYYVDGVLCESDGSVTFTFSDDQRKNNPIYVVYLDIWERQVTYIENNYIREVALGTLGPDTATRGKVEWQVKVTNNMPNTGDPSGSVPIPNLLSDNGPQPATFINDLDAKWDKYWVPILQSPYRGKLKAKSTEVSNQDTAPCIISPESRFRGKENQLYRVEIHYGGPAKSATFKWSRENGSAVFPISSLVGKVVTLDTLGRDKRFGLKPDDWVEIVDDDYYFQDRPNALVQVDTVDVINMQVILKDTPATSTGQHPAKHPFLRRWDQNGGERSNGDAVTLSEGAIVLEEGKWITLEDGIQIWFQEADKVSNPNYYRTGDYWLIPARTATGNIEWPPDDKDPTLPKAVEPHGVEHHFAPLALITFESGNIARNNGICDLRRTIVTRWNEPTGCPHGT